jgi:hypothetical protein
MITKKFAINYLIDNFIIGEHLLRNNPTQDYMYAIDQYWKLLQPANNWYLMNPKIGKQRESYSDIQKTIVNYELFSNNYITIELIGGLGNQLFQIFTLLSYVIDNNYDYYLNNIITNGVRKTLYFDNVFKELKNKINSSIENSIIYNEISEFTYNKLPLLDNNYKLYGYFQAYKYFDHNKNKIIEILKLNNLIDKYKYLYDYNITISLHFRLGDYKAHNMHILDLSYYINSLELLIQKTNKNNWSVLCFYEKNDIIIINDYLNKLQNKFENINFIHINTSLQDFEQLLIMSLCKHNIIANSTFSWFGGYLNNNKNKIVIYPKIWIGYNYNGNNFNFKDLFIDSWIGI